MDPERRVRDEGWGGNSTVLVSVTSTTHVFPSQRATQLVATLYSLVLLTASPARCSSVVRAWSARVDATVHSSRSCAPTPLRVRRTHSCTACA